MIGALVIFPNQCIAGTKEGLELCVRVIVPTLFPFFVLSKLLLASGFVQALARRMHGFMRMAFGLPDTSIFALIVGIVSGNPVGASATVMLYESDMCTKREAERLLCLSNNGGPIFIIGVVGVSMYGSLRYGILLYATHIAAAVIVAIALRFIYSDGKAPTVKKMHYTHAPAPISESLPAAIRESVELTGYICGFIIFFSTVIVITEQLGVAIILARVMSLAMPYDVALSMVEGVLELTKGVTSVASLAQPMSVKLTLTAIQLSLSGVCIFLQVFGIVQKHKLNMSLFVCAKLAQAAVAALLVGLLA